MRKYPRAIGAAGPVKLEREEEAARASGSLAGVVSGPYIGWIAPRYKSRPSTAGHVAIVGYKARWACQLGEMPIRVVSLALSALLLLAAAQGGPQLSAPERFFIGTTEGQGSVHILLSGRHGVRHRGRGRLAADGALLLEQIVHEEGKPARRRSWRLVRSGPNRFTGTISDARGPVTGTVSGNVLHLSYRSAEGPSVEQWITVHPNGRTAANRMTFRRFGLRIATVEESIRRVD